MQFNKTVRIFISTLFILLFTSSCTHEVKLKEVFDNSQPIHITMIYKDDRTMLGEKTEYIIEPGTEKFEQFENWLGQNEKGWKTTIARFEPRSVITQKDLLLNYMGYFISITYKDSVGKSYHYHKTIAEGSLGFLFD